MTDVEQPRQRPADGPAAGEPPGVLLRSAREAAGLNLDEVATQLNLGRETIVALEADDYQHLPPPTFVRGYLRGYGRLLQLDVNGLIRGYDASRPSEPHIASVSQVSAQPSSGHPAVRWGTVAILLALAAMATAWWHSQRGEVGAPIERATSEPPAASAPEPDPVARRAQPTPADEPTAETPPGEPSQEAVPPVLAAAPPAPEAPVVPAPAPVPAESAPRPPGPAAAETLRLTAGPERPPAGGGVAEPPFAAPLAPVPPAGPAAVASVASPSPPPAAAGEGAEAEPAGAPGQPGEDTLVLGTASESWVEVHDADNRQLYYDMLRDGADVRISGRAPFRVFLGNSPAVNLRFNGEARDQSLFNRSNNTARFLVDRDGVRRR